MTSIQAFFHLRPARRLLVVGRWMLAAALVVVASGCAGDRRQETRESVSSTPSDARRPEASITTEPRITPQAWIAIEGGRTLAKVNLDSFAIEQRVSVNGSPHNLTVAGDGTVAATLQGAGTIALLAPGADSVSIVTLGGSPHDVKSTGNLLVVANEGAARLDLVGLDGSKRGSITLPANPHNVAIAPDATTAWVSLDGSNDLALVNITTSAVSRVTTPIRPHDLLVGPDGRLWVTKWGGGLARLSPNGALDVDIPLGEEVHHLALSGDGSQVWATDNAGRQVLVIDTASAQQLGSFALGGSPHHVALAGDRAAVADNTRGVIVVFDVVTRARLGEVPVGAGPHGAWAAR